MFFLAKKKKTKKFMLEGETTSTASTGEGKAI
jgi:hypothetical protein